jgi:hypothetical protein
VNNLLYLYDDVTKKPKEMVILDHQLCREACPTTDLAYFLYTSTTAAVRKPHEDTFLRAYHTQFLAICDQLQCNPLPGFTMDNLKRRYHRSKPFGLFLSMTVLSLVLTPPEEALNMDNIEGGMNDIFSTAMGGQEKNSRLRDRFTEIAVELYEDGVL